MKSIVILRQLPQLFRYADVEKFSSNANVFLTRALAQGFVRRIGRMPLKSPGPPRCEHGVSPEAIKRL